MEYDPTLPIPSPEELIIMISTSRGFHFSGIISSESVPMILSLAISFSRTASEDVPALTFTFLIFRGGRPGPLCGRFGTVIDRDRGNDRRIRESLDRIIAETVADMFVMISFKKKLRNC